MRYVVVLALLVSGCAWSEGVSAEAVAGTSVTGETSVVTDATVATEAATSVVERFVGAIEDGDYEAATGLVVDPPADLPARMEAFFDAIGTQKVAIAVSGSQVTATWAEFELRYELDLIGFGPFSYATTVILAGGANWGVSWEPSILYPTLDAGDSLVVDRVWSTRAPILAADGTELVANRSVKVIGVVPRDIDDLDTLTESLTALTGIDREVVEAELARPGIQPDWFVPVGSLDDAAYAAVGVDVEKIVGVVVRDGTERIRTVGEPFADHLLGATGPITAEMLTDLGAPYVGTNIVGRSGIELALEKDLAGRPAQTLQRVDQFGRVVETMLDLAGAAPRPVQTTLDIDVQRAVEDALVGVDDPAGIVVLDTTTGEVRGVASRPLDGFDRALQGRYPPGSTFKIVSAYALLEAGVESDTATECPGSVVIDGRTFKTASGIGLGEIPFVEAFAESCNTAFAALVADTLDPGDLGDAATEFGFGVDLGSSLPVVGGVFPDPPDLAGRAAASIGQAQVLASPLHVASLGAAVASGAWRAPRLLASDPEQGAIPLDRSAVTALARAMRLVVTDGTGQAADVGTVTVRGKTGTAEFGTDDELGRHAWFVGYWDDLAIAVVVEGGGSGGAIAAPIAARVIGSLSS